MSKKVIVTTLSEIKGLTTGFEKDVNLIMTVTWAYPRANVKQVVNVLDLGKVGSSGLNKKYKEEGLSKKLIFKEENEGQSYLVVEISVVQDESLIGKIINAVINARIATLSNPLVGSAMKTIIKSLNIGDQEVTTIAKGVKGLREHVQGDTDMSLKVPLNIDFPVEEDLWDSDEYDYGNTSESLLKPKAPNGNVIMNHQLL